jgi:hypothetical protein
MKHVIKAYAQQTAYLEYEIVVDVPDDVNLNEDELMELCEDQAFEFSDSLDRSEWRVLDYETPEDERLQYLGPLEGTSSRKADICLVRSSEGKVSSNRART